MIWLSPGTWLGVQVDVPACHCIGRRPKSRAAGDSVRACRAHIDDKQVIWSRKSYGTFHSASEVRSGGPEPVSAGNHAPVDMSARPESDQEARGESLSADTSARLPPAELLPLGNLDGALLHQGAEGRHLLVLGCPGGRHPLRNAGLHCCLPPAAMLLPRRLSARTGRQAGMVSVCSTS